MDRETASAAPEREYPRYPCEVREVFSGDDLVLFIDLGVEQLWKRQRVRLHGVDTPNAVGEPATSPAGMVREGVKRIARFRKGQFTVMSRNGTSWVGVLIVERTGGSGVLNLNQHLIDQGHVYTGSKK